MIANEEAGLELNKKASNGNIKFQITAQKTTQFG